MKNVSYLALALVLVAAGCAKKKPIAQSTPSNPAPAQAAAASSTPAPSRNQSAPPAAPRETRASDDSLRNAVNQINKALEDAFFDFDKYSLRPEAMNSLTAASNYLRDAMREDPSLRLNIEGHADERGSSEYNIALGDRRAQQVKEFLAQLGIPADRMSTVSHGEERPACTEQNEECWQKNRRAHVDYTRN